MGTIVIAYENAVDDSNATITHSTEVAGFEAENVQAAQLSETFRTTVLDPGWWRLTWTAAMRTVHFRLVALLGCKVSAWANRLKQSNALDTSPWIATNLLGGDPSSSIGNSPDDSQWKIGEGTASSVEHYVSQALSDLLDAAEEHGLIFSLWVETNLSNVNYVRLQFFGNSSGTSTADFNLDTKTVAATTGDAVDSSITQGEGAFTNWYQVAMRVDPLEIDTSRSVRIQLLSAAGAAVYTGTSRFLYCSAPQLAIAPSNALTKQNYYRTTTVPGAAWRVQGSLNNVGFLPFSKGNDADQAAANTYHLYSSANTASVGSWIEPEIHDESNASSQIDIGRVFIGPVWQPSQHTFVNLTEDSSGKYRKWTVELGQQITEAERFGELDELRRTLQVVDSGRLRETPSGQLIAEDGAKPVIIILDPDETQHPQEQMLYGWIVGLSSQRTSPVNIGGTMTECFGVTMTVWEALP